MGDSADAAALEVDVVVVGMVGRLRRRWLMVG